MPAEVAASERLRTWAVIQDLWVQAVVAEVLASRRQLSETSIRAAVDRFLVEKQLAAEDSAVGPPVATAVGEIEVSDTLRLIALEDCVGVNALASGQSIVFNPQLTLLFGMNAAGKSGYVRVLKRMANVRSMEEIIPDIHRPSAVVEPSARVRYALGDVEDQVQWNGEAGLTPFTRMSVFDSPAVALHLEQDVTYVYTPAELALFPYVHTAIERVRDSLDEMARGREVARNPFLTAFAQGDPVYVHIETLSASTEIAELEELANVGENSEAELERMRQRAAALAGQASDGRREVERARVALLEHLVALASASQSLDIDAYDQAVAAEGLALAAHALAAASTLGDDQPSPEAEVLWRDFVEAGEHFTSHTRDVEYPADDDSCIYCRQPLEPSARELLRDYRNFAGGVTAAAVQDAQARLNQCAQPLLDPAVAASLDSAEAMLSAIDAGDDGPGWVVPARGLVADVRAMRSAFEARSEAPSRQTGDLGGLVGDLRDALAEAGQLLNALEGDDDARKKALAEASNAVIALEARQKLARLMPEVRNHVAAIKWVDRVRTLLRRFRPLLKSLTEVSKAASEQVLNRDFERVFAAECQGLRAPSVLLDFPGRRGESTRRKSVVHDHALTEILSEGEQKVIAIADFLAETSLRSGSAPVVFDDPVDSFDHQRVQVIADRIATLAGDHQVVVFTHDILFVSALLGHFEGRREDVAFYRVSEAGGHKGLVQPDADARVDTPGSIGKRINVGIVRARAAKAAAPQDTIDGLYDLVRSWCEVVVERELLANVTQRFRPNVAMQNLLRIRADRLEAAASVIYPIWEKANRYTPAHSQPIETLGVRPTLDELEADWKTLQQSLTDFKAK